MLNTRDVFPDGAAVNSPSDMGDLGQVAYASRGDEVVALKEQVRALRSRLSRLTEASLLIGEDLELDAVLREVIDGARALTNAKFGVLLTYSKSGDVMDVVSSGITEREIELVGPAPEGLGLLGYLNEVQGPLRIPDISKHPMSIGFPANHPPMKSFLGMRIQHRDTHLGNIFLTEKQSGQEFSQEDEETLILFASQAGQAISNARRYEEVNRAKADLETLIDISPVGVGVYDAKSGMMVSYNQEMHRIAGGAELAVDSPEPLMELLTFKRADGRIIPLTELPVAHVMLTGETVRADEVLVDFPDGRSITTLLSAAPMFSASGEIESVVVTVQDLTLLEDADKLRAEFLGMVTEALRTPLTTIKGSASALAEILESLNPVEALQLLRIVDQQADLMRSQINSLVELTQIESGALSISPEPASISDLLEISSKEFLRSHSGAAVEANIPPGMPLINADIERLSQVMQNLFVLVSRNSPSSSSVQVSASLLEFYVSISVSFDRESAPGEAFVGRIIHPHLDDSAGGGISFGDRDLAIAYCRGIVEAHGGRLRAQQGDRGYGVTYTVTIPTADEFQVPAGDAPESIPWHERPSIADPQYPVKILLAVPDPRAMGAVRKTLANADYSTISTYDLNAVEPLLLDDKPNLVVLDLNSLESEGLRLTRRLTNEHNTPVIVMSARGDDESVVRAFEFGADDYIVRPFSPTELVARIQSSLRKRSSMQHPQGQSGYALENVIIDYDARTLTVSGNPVQLTATEYKLLYELSTNAGRVLTQDELLHRVWGPEYTGEPQLLRSYVKSLRQKLGDHARRPTYIFTEHGIGYRMAKA